MQDIAGKSAFITGGASGIGLSIAKALAGSGLKIALADVDCARLAAEAATLRDKGATVHEQVLDVADAAAWEHARADAERALGPIQIVCNNAGVGTGANDVADMPIAHWDWAVGINLSGVFYGSRTFSRRLRELNLPGHIVNTASIMGLMPTRQQPAYIATKYAVIGLSETMRIDLAASGIGVSVLCPGLVETPLLRNSMAMRPGEIAGQAGPAPSNGVPVARPPGMEADPIGRIVVEAIRANRFYIFSHPEYRGLVEQRMQRILAAFRDPAQPGYSEDEMFLGRSSRDLFDQDL